MRRRRREEVVLRERGCGREDVVWRERGCGVEGERMWCGGREDVVLRERGCGVEGERMWCGREIHLPGSSSFSSLCPSATWRWWPEAVGRLLSVSHQARMGIIECKKNTLIIIQYTVQVCSMHTCIKTCT